jgi:hypothetical protein
LVVTVTPQLRGVRTDSPDSNGSKINTDRAARELAAAIIN